MGLPKGILMTRNVSDRLDSFLGDLRDAIEDAGFEADLLQAGAENDIQVIFRVPEVDADELSGIHTDLLVKYTGFVYGLDDLLERGEIRTWEPGVLNVKAWSPEADGEMTWHVEPRWAIDYMNDELEYEELEELIDATAVHTSENTIYVSKNAVDEAYKFNEEENRYS